MIATHTINWQGKLLRKILNSVAKKYDCGVRFSVEGNHLAWEGDRACAIEIFNETMMLLGAKGRVKQG